MKARPILFNAPMVRAILEGRKTQTRRAVNPQPFIDECNNFCWNGGNFGQDFNGPRTQSIASPLPSSKTKMVHCPFGKPGDRLWVRETWMDLTGTGIEATTGSRSRFAYRADTPPGSYGDEARKAYGLKWRPSIHMPRIASRILLEITGVRVSELKRISEADAIAEGVKADAPLPPQKLFYDLWASTYGQESWDANPWVWVIDFKRIEGTPPCA